jgi:hypothetical protein
VALELPFVQLIVAELLVIEVAVIPDGGGGGAGVTVTAIPDRSDESS